jgi:adenylate kinase family enzyme
MRRVSVVGSGSGAGKTSFARALARRTGFPFIELDAIHWQQGNWVMPDREIFRARVEEATRGAAWVVDGNYSASRDLVWGRADTVIWLDLPPALMLWRTIRRTVGRSVRGEVLWGGNRETLWNAFVGKDALIPFFIRTYRGRRQRFERELALPQHAHLRVHRFRSNPEAERWLRSTPVP